jgi:hypothetical protein
VNSESIPESLSIPLAALANLGIEQWRLAAWLAGHPSTRDTAPARHAARKLEDFLKGCELEIRSMDGCAFDAGLAVRVIDTVDDARLPAGAVVITETLSPMVLWRGHVIKTADVVTGRGLRG